MLVRIDCAVSPPGLIRNAAAYSLFATDRGLYLIKTGRGWRLGFQPRGRLNRFAAKQAVSRIKRKLSEAEQALEGHNLETELARRNGSAFIPSSDLTELELRTGPLPELRFKGGEKRFRLQFEPDRTAEVQAFVAALRN